MKSNLIIAISLLFTIAAYSNQDDQKNMLSPFPHMDSQAVFTDFINANYKINYDPTKQSATVLAEIEFVTYQKGFPVFDLVREPTSIQLDGFEVSSTSVQTPSNETTVRVLSTEIEPGTHRFILEIPITDLIRFEESGVSSAFWVTDLEDRKFLERYIPVSFEYDRVSMRFDIHFNGLTNQKIFANGKITQINSDTFEVQFPDHYTVSSVYFHTLPKGTYHQIEFHHTSLDGRSIPITVYTKENPSVMSPYKDTLLRTMTELETDYGAFPHEQFIVYHANLSDWGLGGMEYSGATVTNHRSVQHELFHSFFGRGVQPANGNAGWIDEALASWRDRGYQSRDSLSGSSTMASHPEYTRKTDTNAYGFGSSFVALLESKLKNIGGMKSFMSSFLAKRLYTPISTEQFVQDIEEFSQMKFQDLFDKYIYGKEIQQFSSQTDVINIPIHKKLNAEQLEKIL